MWLVFPPCWCLLLCLSSSCGGIAARSPSTQEVMDNCLHLITPAYTHIGTDSVWLDTDYVRELFVGRTMATYCWWSSILNSYLKYFSCCYRSVLRRETLKWFNSPTMVCLCFKGKIEMFYWLRTVHMYTVCLTLPPLSSACCNVLNSFTFFPPGSFPFSLHW